MAKTRGDRVNFHHRRTAEESILLVTTALREAGTFRLQHGVGANEAERDFLAKLRRWWIGMRVITRQEHLNDERVQE